MYGRPRACESITDADVGWQAGWGDGIRRAEEREERTREIWKVEAKEGRVLSALSWRWGRSSTEVSLVEQSEPGYRTDADQAKQYDEQNEGEEDEEVGDFARVVGAGDTGARPPLESSSATHQPSLQNPAWFCRTLHIPHITVSRYGNDKAHLLLLPRRGQLSLWQTT